MAAPDFVSAGDLAKYRDGDDTAILRQVQAAIRRWCGWHIAPAVTETLTLDGDGSRHLSLPSLYVTEIAAITHRGVELDPADVDWSESGYIELRHGRWTDRPRQITVTLTHGYPDIPEDVVELAVSLAARAAASPAGALSESAGGVSLTFGSWNGVAGGIALLSHEKELLSEYRIPPGA